MSNVQFVSTPDDQPHLIAVVDTEEEFDWSAPFSREATSVEHMRHIGRLQEVYDRYKVEPVYVVDYSIASQEAGWRPLRELKDRGRACIGAHLHPWVTPPYDEPLTARNSYAGNLSRELECAKIGALTERIRRNFGESPTVFRAGRYGIGPNTFSILSEAGYDVDLSPAPPLNCTEDGGPDFSRVSYEAFQDKATGLLVIPGTGAFCGWWPGNAASIHQWATTSWRNKLRANSLLNRSGALRRRWLSPESFSAAELIEFTKEMFRAGTRYFVISLHSPVVMGGGTPFATTEAEVSALLNRLNEYLNFFFAELKGKPWTPKKAFDYWSQKPEWVAPRAAALR